MEDLPTELKVKYTSSDALSCKLAASRLQYFQDDYLSFFQKYTRNEYRKLPIINRGYYARVECMARILNEFLNVTQNDPMRQIIILGAGYDTKSLAVLEKCQHGTVTVYDVDFDDIILKRCQAVITSKEKASIIIPELVDITDAPSCKTSYGYSLGHLKMVSCDLRDSQKLVNTLQEANIQSELPTLILSECVLVYIDESACHKLSTALLESFTNVAWASYDMLYLNDAFGRVMRDNLESGGFKVPGLLDFPTIESIVNRYNNAGCSTTSACSMLSAYEHFISPEEKTRISQIEMLDEVEEWQLLMSHYCLSLGVKGDAFAVLHDLFPAS